MAEARAEKREPEAGEEARVTGPNISIEAAKNGRVACTVSFEAPDGVNLSPLLRSVAILLRASFAANIDAGGNPAFAPLSARRIAQKKKMGLSLAPLIASRLLRNSLAQSNTASNVNRITTGGASVVIGTNTPYAAVHQMGGGNNIPARPFMVVQKKDEQAIAALVTAFNRRLQAQAEAQARSKPAEE